MIIYPESYQSIFSEKAPVKVAKMKSQINMAAVSNYALKLAVCLALFIVLFSGFLLVRTEASVNHVAPASAGEQMVVVAQGDTLWEIARKYSDSSDDIRWSVFQIRERNRLSSPDIWPGQKLVIPSS
ncbi:LysM peptidoglycan-binding domain-containing protein [Paenibacillus sp. FSL H8-0537]|uniref:LysM peptidoglycan-binding domain-containing protein n=1 Tax=Paenibacillus sp. FSL H8-0537 TaxID=2921399 RepID=UPI003100E5D5